MALSLEVWLDLMSLRPDVESRAHLVAEIVATGEPAEVARPPATTVLAIDVSGSMQGEPLDQVIRSIDRLLDGLRQEDHVGVIAFSSGATRVVDPVAVDAAGKKLVRARVARLFAEGETHLESGLDLAAEVAGASGAAVAGEARRRAVVLLSDGAPTRGASTAAALREVVRKHRSTTSFSVLGYGVKHDEDILSAIGESGGGGYELVPDPATCGRAFARALGAQADVVAVRTELTIAPAAGIEVARLLGDEPVRFGSEGLTIAVPDLVPGARCLLVAEIVARPPGELRFLLDVARARLTWRRPGAAEASSLTREVSVEIAEREPQALGEVRGRVMLVRADRVRREARALADRGNFAGAGALLRNVLVAIDAVPGFMAGDGSALAEAYELLVDEAMAMERKPDQESYAMFRKSAVGSKLALHAPPAASSRGVASSMLLENAAGKFPEAYLVVKVGPGAGMRHRLREECVIGRTASADVSIASEQVSRRHAEIYALEGEFWACDLGSTGVTLVNGRPLASAPCKLANGDVVRVGDVDLLYEELPGPAAGMPAKGPIRSDR